MPHYWSQTFCKQSKCISVQQIYTIQICSVLPLSKKLLSYQKWQTESAFCLKQVAYRLSPFCLPCAILQGYFKMKTVKKYQVQRYIRYEKLKRRNRVVWIWIRVWNLCLAIFVYALQLKSYTLPLTCVCTAKYCFYHNS